MSSLRRTFHLNVKDCMGYTTNATECRVSSDVECPSSDVECPSSDLRVSVGVSVAMGVGVSVWVGGDTHSEVTQWILDVTRRTLDVTRRTLDGHSTVTRRSLGTRHSTLGGIGGVGL